MLAMSVYEYRPLRPSSREIRLLILEHGEPDDQVQAQLIHASLDDQPTYEALSYTWGDPTNTHPILLNGSPFEVTANLGVALHPLRRRKTRISTSPTRVLWVDAICINQRDLEERSRQIQLMEDIFTSALRVLAWLGEPQDESDRMLDLIHHSLSGATEEDRAKLHKLLDRPYWKRIWIVQELTVAHKVIVFCGNMWTTMEKFTKVFQFNLLFGDMRWHDRLFRVAADYRAGLLHFIDAIEYTREFLATDPLDKVYALLGIVGRKDRLTIMPDYQKSHCQLWMEVSKAIIDND